jgi:hypothetical protein
VGARFCSFGPGIGPLSAWAGALSVTVVNARTIAATEPLMTASVFLIQKPDNFLVSGRHSALFATGVERISSGNAERMTVV